MKVLLTGDEFSAQDAFRWNFVQEIVPAGQERARAIEIAERIADQAPLAVRATLENARLALREGWPAAQSTVAATQQRLYNSEDGKEGVESFVEKRAARFTGR